MLLASLLHIIAIAVSDSTHMQPQPISLHWEQQGTALVHIDENMINRVSPDDKAVPNSINKLQI